MVKRAALAVAIAAGLFLTIGRTSLADEWPVPKDGWWKDVRPGSSATYSMTMGAMATTMVMTVDKVKGSKITVTTRTFSGDEDLGAQSITIDAKTNPLGGAPLPPGTELAKLRTSSVTVGGEAFIATLYEIESNGTKATVWHSSALPPCFAGGAVKLVLDGHMKTTMTLIAYDPR